MAGETQISAVVTQDTKDLFDRMVRNTGLKKGYVLEMALRHHLLVLQEVPADVIIPPRLVLGKAAGEAVAKRLSSPQKPTAKLRTLMTSDGD